MVDAPNRSQLGDRDLPGAQNLQQQGFDVVVDLVEFVDQKHARLALRSAVRAISGPSAKKSSECSRLRIWSQSWPRLAACVSRKSFCSASSNLPMTFFFGDSHVTLKALNHRIGRRRYRIGQLGLATSWRTFHQQWLAHTGRQIHHLQRDWIDDVACRTQLRGEFACRREHVGFLSS